MAEIYPVLTPLAVDPGHPFPYISSLTLSVAVQLNDPETGERRFARVKVPAVLPRLVELPRDDGQPATEHRFVLLDQLIKANLDSLFTGLEVVESHLFRVTRDADLALEEEDADNLLLAIEEELRRRRFGDPVRVEVERSMPAATREILGRGLGLAEDETYEVRGMLDLTSLWQLVDLDRPDLKVKPLSPVIPPRLLPPDEDEPTDMFAAIQAGDILVHHPYESFAASVERLVEQAADDPDVLTIKQTLYRTSLDSEVVNDLVRAAEQGKQVVVLVEVKARFDEQANIDWARKLERAGAHVVYGLVGLKTHCKTLLIVRREGSMLRRYVHIGTGNYNNRTARSYVDLGLFTCRADIGSDVTDLFNILTGLVEATDVPPARRRADGPARAVPRAGRAGDRARDGGPSLRDHPQDERAPRPRLRRRAVSRLVRGSRDRPDHPRGVHARARASTACPSGSASARSSASSSSTPGSGGSPTATIRSGTSAPQT